MDGSTNLPFAASTGLDGPALLDVFDQLPLEIVGGEGAWLQAADGTRYLDFYGGHAVALLGQAHPRLVAALRRTGADALLPEQPGRRSRSAAARPSGWSPSAPRA